MLRRLLLPVFALIVLSPAVVGDAQVAPPAPGPAPAPVPAEDAESTQTLRVAFQEGSRPRLDPHACTDAVSFRLISLAYETLYMWEPSGSPRVSPCLARSFPEVSDDGLTVTIKLDTSATFHNSNCFGEQRTRSLKASDVVHSFKRLAVFSSDNLFWMAGGLIAGLDEYGAWARNNMEYETTDRAVEGLRAPDDETLVIKLTRPYGPLITLLAHPAFSVLPKEAMDFYSGQLRTRMVGTGPYRLNAVASEQLYVFKRWDGYRGDAPDFDRITVAASGYPHLFTGLRDGRLHESPLHQVYFNTVTRAGELRPEYAANAELIEHLEHGYYFLAFNMSDATWGALDDDGRALRQAVSMAFDRAALVAKSGWDEGWAFPQTELFPHGMEFEEQGQGLDFGKTDAAAAKKLLDGTRYKGGIDPSTGAPLILKYLAFDRSMFREDFRRMYDAFEGTLRAACRELGIALSVRYADSDEYADAAAQGRDHLFQAGWFLDYPDASNFLQLFWGANIGVPYEFANHARYDSAEFNDKYESLMKLAPVEENRAKRKELVGAMARELAKDQPIIPLYHQRFTSIRRTDIDWPIMPRQTFNDLRFAGVKE